MLPGTQLDSAFEAHVRRLGRAKPRTPLWYKFRAWQMLIPIRMEPMPLPPEPEKIAAIGCDSRAAQAVRRAARS